MSAIESYGSTPASSTFALHSFSDGGLSCLEVFRLMRRVLHNNSAHPLLAKMLLHYQVLL
jgi:hypothetical protein